jgi:peptidyl-tRNA hydrolase
LLQCEFYDKTSTEKVLDDAVEEFEGKGGIASNLAHSTLCALANSVGMILLRKVHEPTYRKVVKSRSTDFAQYVTNAVNFTYPPKSNSNNSEIQASLQQDFLRRNMSRQPGEPDKNGNYKPQLDKDQYDGGKDYRDKTNLSKKDKYGKTVQYNKRFKEENAKDGIATDAADRNLHINQFDASSRSDTAEADHVIPLQQIHEKTKYFTERYVDLDKVDEHKRTILQKIVNNDANFQILSGDKNASKGGGQNNLQFIQSCENIEKASSIYVNMKNASPERQKELRGQLDEMKLSSTKKKAAKQLANYDHLSSEEKKKLDKYKLTAKEKKVLTEAQKKAEKELTKQFITEGGKTVLLEQIGKVVEIIVGPIGFEIRDSIRNGITHGFNTSSPLEAFSQRIWRALCYSVSRLGHLLVGLVGDLSKMIATFFMSACKMLKDFFGKFFDLALSGISVIIESVKVILGQNSIIEKGNAITKIIVGFVTGILGTYAIDFLLNSIGIPDPFSEIAAAIISTVISSLVMTIFDKIDIFGTKREIRKKRIEELFDLRTKKIKEQTANFDIAAREEIKQSRKAMEKIRIALVKSLDQKDYAKMNEILDKACEIFEIEIPYHDTQSFLSYITSHNKVIIS